MAARPTMDDVAAAAGVSRALVSLVMRESPRVSPQSRQRVLEAASELGYRPNLAARTLAAHRTMLVGVMLDDLHNPFYSELADGILHAAVAHGYRVLFSTRATNQRTQEYALETLLQLRGDGLILVSPRVQSSQLIAAAAEVPLVTATEPLVPATVDSVTNDEMVGARLLVDHLVARQHRRIVHLDGGRGAAARTRRAGYVAAMRAHGLASEVRILRGDFTERAGYEGAGRVLQLEPRPTAIFAANDAAAAGVLDRLMEHGVSVPGDMAVVGYDNTALAEMGMLSITTVDQPRFEMGRLAFELLYERMAGGRTEAVHHLIAPTLVVRRTTGEELR